jgi:hypothetical protein
MTNNNIILMMAFFTINSAHSLPLDDKRGAIAGRFYGAVILASEFTKTSCGKTANFNIKYISVDGAVLEIKSKYSDIPANEIDIAFSKQEEFKQREEMRKLLNSMKLENCDSAKSTLVPFINSEIDKWKNIR